MSHSVVFTTVMETLRWGYSNFPICVPSCERVLLTTDTVGNIHWALTLCQALAQPSYIHHPPSSLQPYRAGTIIRTIYSQETLSKREMICPKSHSLPSPKTKERGFLSLFCGAENWTQGLALTSQAFHHTSHDPSPKHPSFIAKAYVFFYL
jgi:hypothetical protein